MIREKIQKWIDYRADYDILFKRMNLEGTYFYDGLYYQLHNQLGTIYDVYHEYDISGIDKDSIVLDIGANIGAFSMLASKKAKHVYAIEPLYTDILRKNIALNKITNITVLEIGLGTGTLDLKYGKICKKVNCISLLEIIRQCTDKIDFIKCDCEGGEWAIRTEDFNNIKRLEIEVHCTLNKTIDEFLSRLINFKFDIKDNHNGSFIIHAYKLNS